MPWRHTLSALTWCRYLQACLDWVLDGVDGDELVPRPRQGVPVTALNMAAQLCSMLDALLTEDSRVQGDPQVRCDMVGYQAC